MKHIDRYFKLWDYVVSMNKLLIRSPKSGGGRNLDLQFFGVKYMRLGSSLDGVTISESPTWPFNEPPPVELAGSVVFVLNTKYRTDLVVASEMIVQENDLDIMESSLGR
jgi:hypothetical protein